MSAASTQADPAGLVAVRIGPQLCGIPVARVHDILRPMPIAPVPLAPPAIAGSMNLRGRIVTAVDLAARLAVTSGMPPTGRMSVVVASGEERYALLVDDVCDVVEAADSERSGGLAAALTQPWAACGAKLCRLSADGEAGSAGTLLVVLDIDRVLTIAEGN